MNISQKIVFFLNNLPKKVKLVAISKTKPVDDILEAYHAGQKKFGENKVQELITKHPQLPNDIEWHMIGHLQTNKVKFIAPFISLIQAVDSSKLLKTINKEAAKNNRVINCLLQLHVADEETKFGLSLNEVKTILDSDEFNNLSNINITGLMGMATFTSDEQKIRDEFKYLKECFDEIKTIYFPDNENFQEISMGMSSDYEIAIEEGSTMVRIGSSIFGSRCYIN